MQRLLKENRGFVLTAVVESSGSTPGAPGACMIAAAEGRVFGTIGGAEAEGLALEEAKSLMAGGSSLKRYSLHQGEEGLDAHCGGELVVFSQYMDGTIQGISAFVEKGMERFSEKDGTWLIMKIPDSAVEAADSVVAGSAADGSALIQPPNHWPIPATADHHAPCLCLASENGALASVGGPPEDIAALLQKKCVCIQQKGGHWFSRPLTQAGFVFVFGGGHVAQELVPLLSRLDFRCVVFDDREEYTRGGLFPAAVKTVLGDYTRIGDSVSLESGDCAVIVTRGHQWDFQAEAFALRSRASYIGIIGSKTKHAFVYKRLRDAGFTDAEIHASRVHAPIGIDIGSKTPAELAVSIAAELIRIRSAG
jgi:xanthine dehydrogenase accessory factor